MEEELLLTVVWLVAWLVLAVTALTLGMVVDRMGVAGGDDGRKDN